jgi:hypothetical protein
MLNKSLCSSQYLPLSSLLKLINTILYNTVLYNAIGISRVLEYNVKMGNELVPLIYLLYSNLSNLSDADASK